MDLLILVLVGVGIYFLVKRARSFGGVKSMLDPRLKEQRDGLAQARKALTDVERRMGGEFTAAQKAVVAAQAEYENRVSAAEAGLKSWTNPGLGQDVRALGPVHLYEHAIAFSGQPFPLDNAAASVQQTSASAILSVQLQSGQTLMHTYSTEWREKGSPKYNKRVEGGGLFSDGIEVIESTQQMVREFSEEQVIAFGNAINNQSVAHRDFVAKAPSMIPRLEAALQAERDNHVELDAEKSHLANLEAASPLKAELDAARQTLSAAEATWNTAKDANTR